MQALQPIIFDYPAFSDAILIGLAPELIAPGKQV
jgi:hypothetical protein